MKPLKPLVTADWQWEIIENGRPLVLSGDGDLTIAFENMIHSWVYYRKSYPHCIATTKQVCVPCDGKGKRRRKGQWEYAEPTVKCQSCGGKSPIRSEVTFTDLDGAKTWFAARMFQEADDAVNAIGIAAFGNQWGDARYMKKGQGDPGSPLALAWDRLRETREAWEESRK